MYESLSDFNIVVRLNKNHLAEFLYLNNVYSDGK